jgi:tRNA A37 N6-isopentenylltransferase MiaA
MIISMTNMINMQKVIVIVGTIAVGEKKISIELPKAVDGETLVRDKIKK